MGSELADLVAEQNYSATLKLLDGAISHTSEELSSVAQRLAQLHINRGFCHQKLHLNRAALKVWRPLQ
jgi:hypothetical protein